MKIIGVFLLCLALLGADAALAQDCPRDLSALSGEISDPKLRAALKDSIDEKIRALGGLDAVLQKAEALLAAAKQAMAEQRPLFMDAEAVEQRRRAHTEGIKVTEAFVAALKCRKARAAVSTPK